MNYTINTDASTIKWQGSNDKMTNEGKLQLKSGHIEKSGDTDPKLRGEVVIDMTTIMTTEPDLKSEDREKLTNHLKSTEFFDVENYNEVSFKIDEVSIKEGTGFVSGVATIKGQTYNVTVPAILQTIGNELMIEGEFHLSKVSEALQEYMGEGYDEDTPETKITYYILAEEK